MKASVDKGFSKYFILSAALWLFCGAGLELYAVSWGTGNWLGQFAPKWFLIFLFFVSAEALLLGGLGLLLWDPGKLVNAFNYLLGLRNTLGLLRWFFAVLLLALVRSTA